MVQQDREILSKNIRYLRSYYGVSRKALAKLIKMPAGRLRRVEEGDNCVEVYDFHLKRIAWVLGVCMDELLQDTLGTA